MSDRPKAGAGEVIVSFSTKLPEQYQVPEDELVLPSSLARYGLSEVVNRLLSFETPVPFDFLINGEFLRTSVTAYLEAHKLTSEKVVKLEYVLALAEPEKSDVDQVPDWVAGVAAMQALPSSWFAAVSYDGTVRVYQDDRSQLVTRLSDVPLTALAAQPVDSGLGSHVIAAGKDGVVRCCACRHGGGSDPAECGPVSELRGPGTRHAVEAVAINEDGSLLASAGWDQEIFVWNGDVFTPIEAGNAGSGNKRKASGHAAGDGFRPKLTLEGGHSQVVTCLQFGARERHPFTLISGSWDCSMRVWDVAAATCVCNWPVGRAVTSLSVSPAMPSQMVTAHEDGHISIWDVRAAPHPSVQGALSLDASTGLPLTSAQPLHRRLAAQVAWCPEDAYRIASAGHDGNLCIVDPRSPKMPLQSVCVGKAGRNPTKVLCVTWLGRETLAAGGSDGKVVRVTARTAQLPDEAG